MLLPPWVRQVKAADAKLRKDGGTGLILDHDRFDHVMKRKLACANKG
jgi:hypothetical protein